MRTSNPAFGENAFSVGYTTSDSAMTVGGTALKSLVLLIITMASAAFAFFQTTGATVSMEVIRKAGEIHTFSNVPSSVNQMLLLGVLGGFIVGLVVIFWQRSAPVLAPVYALLEGLALGAISAMYQYAYGGGIVAMSMLLTFSIFAVMLVMYACHIIEATENFVGIVVAATLGIALFYIVAIVLSFFGITMPLIHQTGWMGIGFSLFVVVIASLNFVLDFAQIEQGVQERAPKYMEWYGAFGIMVTLFWLYLEILRLLAKLKSKD